MRKTAPGLERSSSAQTQQITIAEHWSLHNHDV